MDSTREPMVTYVRLFQVVVLSVLVGLLYLRVGDDQASVQDREGALYFIMTNNSTQHPPSPPPSMTLAVSTSNSDSLC